jgi:diketogulonate reductase-like aldo/keto reductase
MSLSVESCVILKNGIKIPLLGLGTYQMKEDHLKEAIPAALNCGIRLIDTAASYRNEIFIGDIVRSYLSCEISLSRSDLFIVSKLPPRNQGYNQAKQAIDDSLSKLGLDYIDLYIIHWPGTAGLAVNDPRNKTNRMGSWKALEEGFAMGKLRAIGVSNYLIRHLEEMKEYCTVMPMVNQFELHPGYYQTDLVAYCRMHDIFVQAYVSRI